MSIVVSFYRLPEFDLFVGETVWALQIGWVCVAVTFYRVESMMDKLSGELERLKKGMQGMPRQEGKGMNEDKN